MNTNVNGALIPFVSCLILVGTVMTGCKYSGSAREQQDSLPHDVVHPAVPPLEWDTSFGMGDTILWSHVATFSAQSSSRAQRNSRFRKLFASESKLSGWRLKGFANLKSGLPKDCQHAYSAAPISAAIQDSLMLVEVVGVVYDSIALKSIPGRIAISLGRPTTHCNTLFGGEACFGKTVVFVKAHNLRQISGASSDGEMRFDLRVSGDSLISTSENGEWNCFTL